MKLPTYLNLRIWQLEIAITYNKSLKQVIFWVGKRSFQGKFLQFTTNRKTSTGFIANN